MRGVPGELTTATRPPTTIPLQHFLVALGFLVGGVGIGLLHATGVTAGSGFGGIAVAHLLFVGWICLTILGAMTQFVPVWSGVELHSERLAQIQLFLVAVGVVGFASALWVGRPVDGVVAAVSMVAGFVVFVYNLSRTLWRAWPLDVTEGHFALALGFFAVAAVLGGTLAIDYRWGVFATTGISRSAVIDAHVTLAVFGGVVTTIVGALYQLGPMFTQNDPTALDVRLRRVETVGYPAGVALLAGGRLLGSAPLATVGAFLVVTGVAIAGIVLLRRVNGATVGRTPMLTRYAVVAVAAVAWSLSAGATWALEATGVAVRFGHPDYGTVLLGAILGYAVIGTLYHIVPFIVWLEQYSDRVGLERVPAIDDLYDDRIAAGDFLTTALGVSILLTAAFFGIGPSPLERIAGTLLFVGVVLFAGNMALTIWRHGGLRMVRPPSSDPEPDATDR